MALSHTYQRVKDRARARSAALVAAGQEIGPLPPVVNPQRRQASDGSVDEVKAAPAGKGLGTA